MKDCIICFVNHVDNQLLSNPSLADQEIEGK